MSSNNRVLQAVPRWIQLSVRKQFVERSENIPVFFEETFKQNYTEPLYVELRIDGPVCTQIGTTNEWEAFIEVNALLNAAFNESDTMVLHDLAGVIIAALSPGFCVYKLGKHPIDDKSYFETLRLADDDEVRQSNFGQIDNTNKIYQSTVEAHYRMRFTTNGTT